MSTVGILASIEESFLNPILSICENIYFILISCFASNLQNLILMVIYSRLLLFLDGKSEADSEEAHSRATT
jgi:hypothetical protein